MTVGSFLLRGMLVGFVAGILSFSFLKLVGEPAVDRAIAFETQMDQAKAKAERDAAAANGMPMPAEDDGPELVSRPTQAGIGLFTGVSVYATAFGGLFALLYAAAHGRMGAFAPRATALLLALSGFVAVYVIPSLKYPANPPSVGDPGTIGMRTSLYFSLVCLSMAGMIAAWALRKFLLRAFGAWNAALTAAGAYGAAMVVVTLALPVVNEVPAAFPAVLLWQFRIASLGAQAIMWLTIGLGFGAVVQWTEKVGTRAALSAV